MENCRCETPDPGRDRFCRTCFKPVKQDYQGEWVPASSHVHPPSSGKGGRTLGVVLQVSGLLIAISPLIAGFLDCSLNDNYAGCGAGAIVAMVTFPLGGLIGVIGLIIIAASGRRARRDAATPTVVTAAQAESPTPLEPAAEPHDTGAASADDNQDSSPEPPGDASMVVQPYESGWTRLTSRIAPTRPKQVLWLVGVIAAPQLLLLVVTTLLGGGENSWYTNIFSALFLLTPLFSFGGLIGLGFVIPRWIAEARVARQRRKHSDVPPPLPSKVLAQRLLIVAGLLTSLGIFITAHRGQNASGFYSAVQPPDLWWISGLLTIFAATLLRAHRSALTAPGFYSRTQLWSGLFIGLWSPLFLIAMGLGAFGEFLNQSLDPGGINEPFSPLALVSGSVSGPTLSLLPGVALGTVLVLRGTRRSTSRQLTQ